MANLPGWETEILWPYFLAGMVHALALTAVVSTFFVASWSKGMRLSAMLFVQPVLLIILLCTGVIFYAYAVDIFSGINSESQYERHQLQYRMTGDHAWLFWSKIITGILPLLFLIPALRKNWLAMGSVCVITYSGIWLERAQLFFS